MDKIELGKDDKISLFERFKSLCSKTEIKTKKRVGQLDVIRLLENLEKSDIKRGIDFLDSRPIPSGYEIDYTSAGKNQNPKEIIDYIQRNFYQSEGFYRIYQEKGGDIGHHKIKLSRTNDNSMGTLDIRFSR